MLVSNPTSKTRFVQVCRARAQAAPPSVWGRFLTALLRSLAAWSV
jgi:hypothetical protein